MAFLYTTVDKVRAVLPLDVNIDETSHPTLLQVNVFVTDVEATLNVALTSGGVTLPITGANQLAAYDLLCAKELAFLIMQARGSAKDKESLWQQYHDEWTATIALLSNPATTTAAAGALVPSSYTMNAPDVPDSSVNPVFIRDQAHNW
jgi:hypothetical protein